MKFEPQTFFIGVIDFFSILMPGSLLTYFAKGLLFGRSFNLESTESLVVFLFVSYLAGHFIFLIGSVFLDEHVYDKIRKWSKSKQIERLAKGKMLNSKLARWIGGFFFKDYSDESLRRAENIKDFYLDQLLAKRALNTFQWCKARLEIEASPSMLSVQGFEANSKFFRSLFVVLIILLFGKFLYPCHMPWRTWPFAITAMILAILSLNRYINQREKSISQAFWNIITLEANRKDGFRQKKAARTDGLTHAGGIVFTKDDEILLVRPTNDNSKWVLPKGHIEPGESIECAAVREVREETGTWARIVDPKIYQEKEFEISKDGKSETVRVRYYRMEFLEKVTSKSRREKLGIEDRAYSFKPVNEIRMLKEVNKVPAEVLEAAEAIAKM